MSLQRKKLLESKDQEHHQMQVEKVIKAVKKLKKPQNRRFPQKKNRYLALQILKAVIHQLNLLKIKKLKNLNLKKLQLKKLLLHQMILAQMIPINHQRNQKKLTKRKKFLLLDQMTIVIPMILQRAPRKKLKKKKKKQNLMQLQKKLKEIQMIQISVN
jgi:hypothetical protein